MSTVDPSRIRALTVWTTRRSFAQATRATSGSESQRACAFRKSRLFSTRTSQPRTSASKPSRIAIAWPLTAERKRPWFSDVISRPSSAVIGSGPSLGGCANSVHAYNNAPRDEAEEKYGDYVDVVETGTELLADLRDHFAATLDEETSEAYEEEFNRAVLKRLPRFALEIENR